MIQTRFAAISSADFSWSSGILSDDYAAELQNRQSEGIMK
jgi:hypothetical protein